jgi:hypothetical protein
MKKILLSLVAAATLSLSSFGQAPEGFKYQAVVRDAGNTILNNQAVGLRMTIQQGAIGGTTVYAETFAPTTNAYGLVNLEIGNGTVVSGTFANIDWSAGPYFMETAVDVTGGTSYVVMGTSQLMSVPYALYAKTSGNGQGPEGPQGIQGPAGVDGTNGTNGTNGIDGVDGAQGPQGIQGPAGVDGTNGTNGIDGADGATGPQGIQGIAGIDGATGPQGPQGLTGPQGTQGIQGIAGTNGIDGVAGADGLDGAPGAAGPQGPAGADGIDGAIGATGPAGANGLGGAAGATGPQGPAGANGLDGATGATGPQGPQGPAGANGLDGAAGATGPQGADGATGPVGADGAVGATGPQGIQGDPGVDGTDGAGFTDGDNSGDMKYWNGTAWVTIATTLNEGATLQMISGVPTWTGGIPTPPPAIGDTYQGGIVFYLDGSGGGLIAAPSDQATAAEWGCYGTGITGADGTAIGTGVQNTIDIEAGCTTIGTAADICANLVLAGYTDWFLPSTDELNLMYQNIGQGNALGLGNVGGFASSYYWSSTELDVYGAWARGFGNGGILVLGYKVPNFDVRAVRAF